MPIKIAINGLGRIGRLALRSLWDAPDVEIMATNSRSSAAQYAHLIKYDSCYKKWDKEIIAPDNDTLVIDGQPIKFLHGGEPGNLPWKELDIDVVIESTGVFRDRDQSAQHLKAGAKRVIITAPAKDADATLLPGINLDAFDADKHKIISIASCTTNCLAPAVKILNEKIGIKHGFMATAHAYTNDQRLVDAPHPKEDFRRARAASVSIIPTSTGAAKAIGQVIPALEGKLNGIALRVPVEVVSVINLTLELEKKTSSKKINEILADAANGEMKDILDVSDEPLVSVDYEQNPHACIVDALSTEVVDGTMANLILWYDNEWGYVQQLVKLIKHIG